MKRFLIVFSIFCMVFMASCSVKDNTDFEIDPGDTGTTDADTTDPDGSDTDNADTDDSGTDTDSNDTGIPDDDTSDSDTDGTDDSDSNEPDENSDDTEISDNDTSDSEDNDHDNPEDPDENSDDTEISDNDTSDSDNNDQDDPEDPDENSDDTEISDNDTSDSDDNDQDDQDNPENPDENSDDTEISDNDTTDNDPDDTDDTDDTDDSDTEGSSDEDADTDTDSGESTEIPECSSSSTTPCKAGNLIWSSRSTATKDWESAKSDCSHWSEDTLTGGWKLPTISELRTLIINCQKTETNGNCGVTDQCVTFYENIDGISCYSNSSCNKLFGDICPTSQEHSILGDKIKLWSSSYPTDNPGYAWAVDFNNGSISFPSDWIDDEIYYRCVHSAN